MQIYGLRNCDTCRKAVKALPAATLIDVREDGLPPEVLDAAEEKFGAALLNTRSTTWRGLGEAEKSRPARALLKAYPTLMKRPLIVTSDAMYLGWSPAVQVALEREQSGDV